MRKLSPETREVLSNDEFMKTCCLLDFECSGRIEFHHNLIYGSKQSDIPNTLLPLCKAHHDTANKKDVKAKLNWIMLNRMSDIEINSISKAIDYFKERTRLNKIYG